MSAYRKIERCRVCGNPRLERVLDLGEQMLTGVFPRNREEAVTVGPLRLVKCLGGAEVCGLLQLEHSYDLSELYGHNYGYRSGLNQTMVDHLHRKVDAIRARTVLHDGDLVIDIGSNDSTTLQGYPATGLQLVGIDPTGVKFKRYYPSHIRLIADFFSAALVQAELPGRKAKVITSFSMFYDLEEPMEFMRQIHDVLADDGIWVFEQSYMPTMLRVNAYDTVCHEHLEYYGLQQIKWMTDRVGLRIVDVEQNDVNGGSFSVTVMKSSASGADPVPASAQRLLDEERALALDTLEPYREFARRAEKSKREMLAFLATAKRERKVVAALGASTKGNVLLQYWGLTSDDIAFVGEVNPDKFGCVTPGTWIPIIPEDEVLKKHPDYLLVLPWHFWDFFAKNPKWPPNTLIRPPL